MPNETPDIDFLRNEKSQVVDRFVIAIVENLDISEMTFRDLDESAKSIVYFASRLVLYRYKLELSWIEKEMAIPVTEEENDDSTYV